MHRFPSKLFLCTLIGFLFSASVAAQHLADPEFNAIVRNPAYAKSSPRVMFDEAHNNFHTTIGRYKPFADLLMNDGYRLVINRQSFTKKTLDSFKLLVVANALGDDIDEPDADKPALTEEECTVVRDWVKDGGSLLLIADPGPFGRSVANLAKLFGIEMAANIAEDPANSAEESRSSLIVYSRDNHQLVDHAITSGRDSSERVNRVLVFEGQSLKGPQDSIPFLKLSDSAKDVAQGADGAAASVTSAQGFAQGLALKFGGGRVVVLGEAEMLSALLGDPPGREPIGMNYPGIDNKQLALNIMHWLSGLLK
jgi:hypothetical protein